MSASEPGRRLGSAAREMDPLPRFFGRYQLFDRIGRGGMANIYLARVESELGGDRLVVVKQILPQLSRDATFAQLFIEEAKLCAGLRHQNVVQVIDLGRDGELLYMAMEYVEGFDLNGLLGRLSRARVPLPLEFAVFVVREVLAALHFAHRAKGPDGSPSGIVHRDVSPSNVLMSFEGEVKLCDFGIARAAGRASVLPGEDIAARPRIVGKSAYMSPEQARGEELDGRADVFAAGILLWELAAGRRLYKGTEDEMLELARRAEVPPLPDRGLPAQAALQAVLDRALARERKDRFESAAAMRDALEGYAFEARLIPSQIRFGAFLDEHFGGALVEERRARERAARALARGPAAIIEPIEDDTDEQPIHERPTEHAQESAQPIAEQRASFAPPPPGSTPPSAPAPNAPAPEATAPARSPVALIGLAALLVVVVIVGALVTLLR